MGVIREFNLLLTRHPYRMNMLLMGLAYGTGDLVAQYLFFPFEDQERFVLDQARLARALVYGTAIFGPVTLLWHGRLKLRISNPFVRSGRRQTWPEAKTNIYDNMFRMTVDQLTFPSLIWIPLYNISMSTLSYDEHHQHPLDLASTKLKNNWWFVLTSYWKAWIPINMLTIFLIPPHFHSLVTSVCTVGWSAFLSYTFNSRGRKDTKIEVVDPGSNLPTENEDLLPVT